MRPIAIVSTVCLVLGLASLATAQHDVFIWVGTTGANGDKWLQGGNWNGPPATQYPGLPGAPATNNGGAANDEADFGAVLPSTLAVGIDMSLGSGNFANQFLQLGGISFQNNTNSLAIGNNSTTVSGVLQLNGTALPVNGTSFNNVILSNTSTSQILTLQDQADGGTQTMTLSVPSASRVFTNSGATTVISIPISGAGSITHYGAGTLALSGASTYSAGTVVEQGTLQVTNASGSATGTGTVSVASGATLSGTGALIPNTGTTAGNTVAVSGTLQPGTNAATGTLTVGSPTTSATASLNSGSTYRWTVSNAGNPSTVAGGSSTTSVQSNLVVNGDLTFTPGSFEIVGLGSTGFDNTQPYSWRVATGTGSVSIGSSQPTFSTVGLNGGSGSFFLSSDPGAVFLNFAPSPSPEPATILFVCTAAFGVVHRLRRHHATSPAKTARLSP